MLESNKRSNRTKNVYCVQPLLVTNFLSADSNESQHGSFAMQAIVRATAKYAKKKDLTELLTVANEFLRKKSQNAVIEFQSTLCKKLYFYPGISFVSK